MRPTGTPPAVDGAGELDVLGPREHACPQRVVTVTYGRGRTRALDLDDQIDRVRIAITAAVRIEQDRGRVAPCGRRAHSNIERQRALKLQRSRAAKRLVDT